MIIPTIMRIPPCAKNRQRINRQQEEKPKLRINRHDNRIHRQYKEIYKEIVLDLSI